MLETVDDFHHLNTVSVGDFLGVTRVRDRLVFIILQANMSQLRVGHVFYINPLNAERALPLILRPNTRVGIIIDLRYHLSHATEVTGAVNRKEQVDNAVLLLTFSECLVQSLVAMLRGAPNLILDTAMDVIFRI